jgi:hypothetical protein
MRVARPPQRVRGGDLAERGVDLFAAEPSRSSYAAASDDALRQALDLAPVVGDSEDGDPGPDLSARAGQAAREAAPRTSDASSGGPRLWRASRPLSAASR